LSNFWIFGCIGVPLIDGGTIRLPHLIGMSRAMDLILTGRAVKGKEAYEIGLANRLVPQGDSLQQAIKLANEIAQFPQDCMNRDRLSANYALYSAKDFQDAIQNEMKRGLEVIHKVLYYKVILERGIIYYYFYYYE
jgi:enoyl-CoA hydratase/carnithine racemase